jgi:CIC family chloride channel protein
MRWPRIEPENQFLILSAAVGAAGALVNFAFRGLIEMAQGFLFGGSHDLLQPTPLSPFVLVIVLAPAVGGLAVGLLGYFSKSDVGGYGMPAFLETVNLRTNEMSLRKTLLRACAAVLSLGSGGSAGAEGPIASLGGGLAAWIAKARRVHGERLRLLIACGASAAVAAAYGAPIAGVFFTQEIILAGNYDLQNFVRVVVASGSATVVARAMRGDAPMFATPVFTLVSSTEVLFYLALGLACGVAGPLFSRLFFWTQRQFQASPIPKWARPAVGGMLVGVLAIGAPGVLGNGYAAIARMVGLDEVAGQWAFAALALLVVCKMIATSVTIGSGGAGGVFGPSLCMGAALGAFVGGLAHRFAGTATGIPAHYALVGMGAFLAATVRAPLTSIFLVFEITGSSSTAVLPTLVAVAASLYVARKIESHSIEETALARRGIHLKEGRELAVLDSVTTAQAMRPTFEAVHSSATAPQLQALVSASRSSAFIVVDDDERMVGILSLQDLRILDARTAHDLGQLTIASDLCERNVISAFLDEPLSKALARMDQFGFRQLPVVERDDPRRVIGMLERRHVLAAYRRHLTEQAQTRFYGKPSAPAPDETAGVSRAANTRDASGVE